MEQLNPAFTSALREVASWGNVTDGGSSEAHRNMLKAASLLQKRNKMYTYEVKAINKRETGGLVWGLIVNINGIKGSAAIATYYDAKKKSFATTNI